MLSLLALAAATSPPPPRAAIDPLGTPAQVQEQIEALNARPLPENKQLAVAVLQAVQADAVRRNRCRPNSLKLGALQPVTLDAMVSGMITKGMIENGWMVSVDIANCPPADPIRVLVVRAADGHSLTAMFVGQGESLAWPSVIRDALRGLVGAASQKLRAADPQCAPKDLTPTGIRITTRSPDLAPDRFGIRFKGSWSEVWAFEPCNHRIAVPIDFRADGKGGAYWTIAADKIAYVP